MALSGRERVGVLPGSIGRVSAAVYAWEVRRRNARFDAGLGVRRFAAPVISVGNLSVGGTGKTPMVARVVERLLAMGRRPMIAMRGYKAERGGMSDEEAEYRGLFGDAVVVRAQPDRTEAIAEELGRSSVDTVVLDDGFQHRRVARDLDMVLLDATHDVLRDRCLPAGWLREPMESLARADLIVLTRTEHAEAGLVQELEEAARAYAPVCIAKHAWAVVEVHESDGRRSSLGVEDLRGWRVVVACGIGNPRAFERQARTGGVEIARTWFRGDHAAWRSGDVSRLRGLAREADADVLTTRKDAVKLMGGGGIGVRVLVPRVEMVVSAGVETFEACLREALDRRGDADGARAT